jgi:hypothetical protein
VQTVVHDCFAQMDLDAMVYPSGNIPPGVLTAPPEPTVNDRGLNWTAISSRGFAAMTVPAGFTTVVYDRGDRTARCWRRFRAALPVGMDILGLPFSEADGVRDRRGLRGGDPASKAAAGVRTARVSGAGGAASTCGAARGGSSVSSSRWILRLEG